MPQASETERRAVTDRQLHETVTAMAWAKANRARRAEAKAARTEAAATQSADDVPAASVAPVVLTAPRPAAVAPVPGPGFADVDD